jgi:hypothetical protein
MKLKALASMAALMVLAGAAQAGDVPAADTPQALRAVRDKDTGKLRAATAEEAKAMAEAEKAARAGQPAKLVVVRQYASGMRSATLTPEHLSTLKAERLPSGALKISHPGAADSHAAPVQQDRPTE